MEVLVGRVLGGKEILVKHRDEMRGEGGLGRDVVE